MLTKNVIHDLVYKNHVFDLNYKDLIICLSVKMSLVYVYITHISFLIESLDKLIYGSEKL